MAQVLLFTDRPDFEAELRTACAKVDVELRTCAPEAVAEVAAEGQSAVFDGASTAFDEDELLASVGMLRALGAHTAVVLAADRHAGIEDLLCELCAGAIARSSASADLDRLASSLARRSEEGRETRFEYLSVSPRGSELLAVLGGGRALLLARPFGSEDDGSEVSAIHLAADARSAEVELSSGARIPVSSSEIRARTATSDAIGLAEVDGATLGKRLRELRLAAGLTQAELARRTGIHRPNIARVEAGRHTPSLETLARLAQAIGVSTTRVLSD